jgi:hypothetical protein
MAAESVKGMPWEVIHFFVNTVEVIAAMAGVLASGLLIALTGLWILPKIFGVKAEEPPVARRTLIVAARRATLRSLSSRS